MHLGFGFGFGFGLGLGFGFGLGLGSGLGLGFGFGLRWDSGYDEQGVGRTCRLVATSAMSTCGSSEPEARKAPS